MNQIGQPSIPEYHFGNGNPSALFYFEEWRYVSQSQEE
ncbi:hypothetical protein SORDD17_01696 [Streptococcus oralis]|uniref:Uncharacterized protein n=1 Tax=Streptococcus oralis TaxID=1303 RepID=A0A139RFL1_STROR|nr:hypothetical protein SORDD17_01696 [Streptococcus oralis]